MMIEYSSGEVNVSFEKERDAISVYDSRDGPHVLIRTIHMKRDFSFYTGNIAVWHCTCGVHFDHK